MSIGLQFHTRYVYAAELSAQSTSKYDTIIRRMWVMAASRNFTFKIAIKPLQIETWLGLLGLRGLGL